MMMKRLISPLHLTGLAALLLVTNMLTAQHATAATTRVDDTGTVATQSVVPMRSVSYTHLTLPTKA